MNPYYRWNECVDHYDQKVDSFFAGHFSETGRLVLLIAGAGFDPRATITAEKLKNVLGNSLSCIFIKEERPNPDSRLVQKANQNLELLKGYCPDAQLIDVRIFADDSAVVGGINIVARLANLDLQKYTDVIIDMSALSIGISFPVVKLIYDKVRNEGLRTNIHLMVVSNPNLDATISSQPNDSATEVRGFPRSDRLYGEVEKAKLWLPQLSGGRKETLRLIYENVQPHDTCPILPFPSSDPKKGDKIAVDFIPELESEWRVDTRNFVYADESNPLDIYRTILRIDDQRKPVFQTFGGSAVILSPLGSKLLAIGALMAALEREFPIVYVEAIEYFVDWEMAERFAGESSKIAHIWLHGEAYLRDSIQEN